MSYLRNIIVERKDELPKEVLKLVNKLYNKIKYEYCPDNKNIEKLKVFSTNEVNIFLLECLSEYDSSERLYLEHHDIGGLRSVWSVLAFSKEENVLKYFSNLIDKYISDKPFFLHFLFELFDYSVINHPLYNKIKNYYDKISENLPANQLLRKLEIEPFNKYDWYISLTLTTDGERFTPNHLTDEQKEKRFIFKMSLSNPRTLNDTYEISIQNNLSQKRKRIDYSESGIFTIRVNETAIEKPDLLNLNEFINKVEQYFNIKFDFEKIVSLSVSKGIKRKKIEEWIRDKFKK